MGSTIDGSDLFETVASPKLNDNVEFIEYLLTKTDKTLTPTGENPLFAAAFMGYKNIFNLFIERGENIRARANSGKTVLHNAARGNQVAMVDLIISMGVDSKVKNNNGENILHAAAQCGATDVVVHLLDDLRFNINEAVSVEYGKRTALYYAIQLPSVKTVEVLLERNADLTIKEWDRTPLFEAGYILKICSKGSNAHRQQQYYTIISLLLECGADYKRKAYPASDVETMPGYLGMPSMAIFEERFGNEIETGKNRKKNKGKSSQTDFFRTKNTPVSSQLTNDNNEPNKSEEQAILQPVSTEKSTLIDEEEQENSCCCVIT